jgi:hypothetical protein
MVFNPIVQNIDYTKLCKKNDEVLNEKKSTPSQRWSLRERVPFL